jgi:hypothetical protein
MATDKRPADGGVSHGTINVVLANQNGIVVLTDSIVTCGDRQQAEPAQKLFKLDDRTVCTVAGFLAAPGPGDLYMASSALIHEYSQQISSNPPQTIRAHLTSLAFLFKFLLSAIATIRDGTGSPTDLRDYESQLTIAGYDIDGIAKIGQVTLWTVPNGNSLTAEVLEQSIKEVGKPFVFKLAGVDEVAERFLHYPDLASDDPVLASYATSMQRDQGKSLSISDMKLLASQLAKYTTQKHPSVGGDNQVAVLRDGEALNVKQRAFPPLQKALVAFSIVVDSSIGAIGFPPGQTLLFLRTKFDHMQTRIDGNYFFDSSFNNCTVRYDGAPFYFDKSNKIANTSLILGPNVKPEDHQVQDLLRNFRWFGNSFVPK